MPDEIIREEVTEPVAAPALAPELVRRVSWGAVWAGVMIALGMEALFTLFGSFIGFGMYNAQAANPWGGVSVWTTVWYLVTAGWSMFFGAWCAARLSGNPVRGDGILHGVTTWGLATFATIMIVAVTSWAVLREGINVLTAAALSSGQVAPIAGQAAAPSPQATANIISGISLRIWGGVLLGFLTAILGGWAGRSRAQLVSPRGVVPVPTRRAA
jgi:hypothetical protein